MHPPRMQMSLTVGGPWFFSPLFRPFLPFFVENGAGGQAERGPAGSDDLKVDQCIFNAETCGANHVLMGFARPYQVK